MKRVIFLTFNDPPSGIFVSQVTDVVKYLRQDLNIQMRLVSFISLRNFSENRKRIKNELPRALVIPMVPGVKNWRLNAVLLRVVLAVTKPDTIIARSVLATQLALKTKRRARVIYDGRGAITAEWKEYGVVSNPKLLRDITQLEKEAILKSDFRIAVSYALVAHWRETFGYAGNEYVVVPCTLGREFEKVSINVDTIANARRSLGFAPGDMIFVYSGSISGWQGFTLLYDFMVPLLHNSPKTKLLLLSPSNEHTKRLLMEFPAQVQVKHVVPHDVPGCLIAGDYGLLIREASVTNRVASPVKFAEYLACGVKVVISQDLGDYTNFVKEHNCGCTPADKTTYMPISLETKLQLQLIARNSFHKMNYKIEYLRIIGAKG
jgi:hypothetical protein